MDGKRIETYNPLETSSWKILPSELSNAEDKFYIKTEGPSFSPTKESEETKPENQNGNDQDPLDVKIVEVKEALKECRFMTLTKMKKKSARLLYCPISNGIKAYLGNGCEWQNKITSRFALLRHITKHFEKKLVNEFQKSCCLKIKPYRRLIHISLVHSGLETILKREDPKALKYLNDMLANFKEQDKDSLELGQQVETEMFGSCPFEDCYYYAKRTILSWLLKHLGAFHFYEEINKKFRFEDIDECRCGFRGNGNNFSLMDHWLNKHDALKSVLGVEKYRTLLLNSEVAKDK